MQSELEHPGIYEPLNDILVNEYQGIKEDGFFKYYSSGYNQMKPYIFTLIEIIGSKPFLEYNFKGDITSIENELKKIIDDESKIYELYGYLDAFKNNLVNKNGDNNLNKVLGNKIEKILSEYYLVKYNSPMEENFEILSNLHKNSVPYLLYNDYGFCEVVIDKMYFNNKYLNEYILNTNLKEQINSEICYIDYTANLVITTSMIMKKYKQTNSNLNISEICNEIINTCKMSLIEQIKNNKYFTKYIIVFDYKYLSKFNLNFKLSEELLNECINNLQFNKDHIDAIPMIPKTYLNDDSFKESLKNEVIDNSSKKDENNLNEISQRGFQVNENNKTLNINIHYG